MNRTIRTYEDLLQTELALKAELRSREVQLRQDWLELQETLEPVSQAFELVGNLTTRKGKESLLVKGADFIIDFILNKTGFLKKGFLTRLIGPWAVKNYVSHLISKNREAIEEKLVSLVTPKSNGHAAYTPEPEPGN